MIGVEGARESEQSAKEKSTLSLAETLQEHSDEAAWRSPAGKRPPGTEINGLNKIEYLNNGLGGDPHQEQTNSILSMSLTEIIDDCPFS